MRTKGLISTISYNSKEFLELKLKELYNKHTISDYMFIEHVAEEDEKKDHIHLLIEPNSIIDTMDLQDFFKEIVPFHDKPLGCINFCKTHDMDDWILYSLHDPSYLAFKGESREFLYEKKDFHFCDELTFEHHFLHAYKGSKFALECNKLSTVNDVIKGVLSPQEAFVSGRIPIQQAGGVNSILYMQGEYEKKCIRNGHKGHE